MAWSSCDDSWPVSVNVINTHLNLLTEIYSVDKRNSSLPQFFNKPQTLEIVLPIVKSDLIPIMIYDYDIWLWYMMSKIHWISLLKIFEIFCLVLSISQTSQTLTTALGVMWWLRRTEKHSTGITRCHHPWLRCVLTPTGQSLPIFSRREELTKPPWSPTQSRSSIHQKWRSLWRTSRRWWTRLLRRPTRGTSTARSPSGSPCTAWRRQQSLKPRWQTHDRFCGVGYMPGVPDEKMSSWNFWHLMVSVTTVKCALGTYTFGHEVSHNMGIGQWPRQVRQDQQDSLCPRRPYPWHRRQDNHGVRRSTVVGTTRRSTTTATQKSSSRMFQQELKERLMQAGWSRRIGLPSLLLEASLRSALLDQEGARLQLLPQRQPQPQPQPQPKPQRQPQAPHQPPQFQLRLQPQPQAVETTMTTMATMGTTMRVFTTLAV